MRSITARGFWALAPESRKTRSGLFAKIGNSHLSIRGSNPLPNPPPLAGEGGAGVAGKTLLGAAVAILIPPKSPGDGRAATANAHAAAANRPVRPPPAQRPRSAYAAPPRRGCRALADKRAPPRRDHRPRHHGCISRRRRRFRARAWRRSPHVGSAPGCG